MASLALGLALGGVGNFLLPGIGGSLGFSIGAMIGSRIGHKSHQSPQIKDLRVQTSEYGSPIPIGYGTIRIAGWLEWAADKVPHKHKQGGKGSPKVTTTTYTCSFAVGLLETSFLDGDGALVNNPILGILRVWANGRLVWGDGSPAEALPMQIYYGTEDQLPDPTIEAHEGVGEVSGNRGKAYVVFTDLELAPYGDAIPNFTFEVVASGAIGLDFYAQWPVDYDFPVNASAYSHPYTLNGVERTAAGLTMHRYRSGDDYGAEMGTGDASTVYYDQTSFDLQGAQLATADQITTVFPTAGFGHINEVYGSMNNGIGYVYWGQDINCGAGNVSFSTFAWMKDGVATYTPSDLCGIGVIDRSLHITGTMVYWNGNVYATGGTVSTMWVRRWPAPDGAVYIEAYDAEFNLRDYSHDDGASGPGDLIIGDDGYLYCRVSYSAGAMPDPEVLGGWGVKLIKLDSDLNLVKDWYDPSLMTGGVSTALGTPGRSSGVVYHGHWISYHSAGILTPLAGHFILYRIEADESFTFVDELAPVQTSSNIPSALIYLGGGLAAFRGGIISLGSGTITLGEMVANVSQHVGYADDEYDVSQLTDVVRGACISQRTSGRSAIEPWQLAYGFGGVESNFEVKFVKWGGEVQVIIPDEDLGARPSGTDPVDPLRRTLITDKDLPRMVEVVFLNKNMDYQEGMQYFLTPSRSDLHVALSMALVFTDTEAKAVAENIGTNALVERNKYSFQLAREYAHLEPTDVIAINEQAIRITSKDEQGYTHIAYEGISTRIGEWIVAPVAPQTEYVPQGTPVAVKTDLLLLDTALVSDADYPYGFNAAVAGTTSAPWPGAGLYKSIDGGATYAAIAAMASADVFGVATTVLGDFGGGNIIDELNTFTVRLTPGSGELASTNYLGLINGANLFALGTEAGGYELAQYRDAELLEISSGGSQTYQLSGLLRGRRGTEWAMATHAINDNFVFLPAHNVDGIAAELGAERLYKAVTAGSVLASAIAVEFTNRGAALKPYAPVLLGGGRNAAGDIIINWARRTRIGSGMWITVPLSETTELYELTVYTDGTFATVKRSGAVAVQTLTYTAALQTTDWGSPQATIYVGVKQLGSYGYGYEARAII